MEKYPDKIHWSYLSKNPAAIHLLEANQEKIDPLLLNVNPAAIHLLEAHSEWIDSCYLCKNPNAIPLIEKLLDRGDITISDLNCSFLCDNVNAIPLIKKNINHIINNLEWVCLFGNPNAIKLIKELINTTPLLKSLDYYWDFFSTNPAIFDYDYSFLKNRAEVFKEELIAAVFHPRRVAWMLEQCEGGIDDFEGLWNH